MRDEAILEEVKSTLAQLEKLAPGRAIEVRVPPYAAIQCGEGPTHTRGTPPNVIEMGASTWLALARGEQQWADAFAAGDIRASGARADLSEFLPLPTKKRGLTHGA
jgi:hypothetical protein